LIAASIPLCPSASAAQITLAGAHIRGNTDLTEEDLLRGFGLVKGGKISRAFADQLCDQLKGLKLFDQITCDVRVEDGKAWIDLSVQNFMPVVFDNFVWTTPEKLVRRLKQKVPLFMMHMGWGEGLNDEIVRALDETLVEDGIKGQVYHDTFWDERGGLDYRVKGVQEPVVECRIEGPNPPARAAFDSWEKFCRSEDYSAAGLAFSLSFAIDDLYRSRGYMRPQVGNPETELMPSKDASYPVRVIFKIDSGPQYKFESITFTGMLASHAETLKSQWQPKPGDVFDEAYVKNFGQSSILSQPWAANSDKSSDDLVICETTDPVRDTIAVSISLEKPKKSETVKFVENVQCFHQFSLVLGRN
jgi:hypothetical protein